ncbi:acyl carrier protein [Dactylosporangium aurantiacum]|uniref:Acyl carrier protein n=1 Tax=Dactylosporangium aurantiacum TaxID=35754 RepID=A0A9Q9INZ8_9ACTN|nr:phosphopantetheine-binding protein [Dactylosporangium aurantiacum]MDG6108293.1 phosphopantetheine-binding protein [Dactylosporangium aurantiacum]UWZ58518.1 acyl carrier protein [Dactylosporangium aurantiacum]
MNRDEATEAIRAALREVAPDVDPAAVPPDAELREAFELDSLDFLRVVEQLTGRTGIRIDEDDYPKLATISAAADWLCTAGAT